MSRYATVKLIGALVLPVILWFYVHHILVPSQKSYAITHQIPRGNLSDLYPRWLGARELLLNGKDPYSQEITREIQIGYYGRPLDDRRPNDPKDQAGFAYPVYVVFLLAPAIFAPFPIVQICAYWLFTATIIGTVVLWLKIFCWRPHPLTFLVIVAFTLGNVPALQALGLRQLSIVVAAFLALAFFAVSRRKFILAGLIFALAMIKPQLAVPVVAWLGVWMIGCWRERKGLLFGFCGGMAVLLASAEWVLPGWIIEFYHAVLAYKKYTGALTAADVLFSGSMGSAINILLILIVAVVCGRARSKSETSVEFSFVSCLVLTATVIIAPIFAPYNQLLLIPGFLLLIQHRNLFNPKKRWQKILLGLAFLIISWQWLSCVVLIAIYILVSAPLVARIWAVPFYASLPLPMVIMCLLYISLLAVRNRSISQNVSVNRI